MDSPGFVWLLSHVIQIRNGAEHWILFWILLVCMDSPGLCGFFPTTTGFVWLPQLA